jgi:hypothetical protein
MFDRARQAVWVAAFIVMIPTARAQVGFRPFLYAIEKNGVTSYVLGSRHTGLNLKSLGPLVVAAIKSTNAYAVEFSPENFTVDFKVRTRLPGNESLKRMLGDRAWRTLVRLHRVYQTGENSSSLDKLKPFAAWDQLQNAIVGTMKAKAYKAEAGRFAMAVRLERQILATSGTRPVFDDWVVLLAERSGLKKLDNIENKNGLFDLLEEVLTPSVVTRTLNRLDLENVPSLPEHIFSAGTHFISGDEAKVQQYQGGQTQFFDALFPAAQFPELHSVLQQRVDRHKHWIGTIEKYHRDQPTFFALGIVHLVASDPTLLQLLAETGFQVRRIEDTCEMNLSSGADGLGASQ